MAVRAVDYIGWLSEHQGEHTERGMSSLITDKLNFQGREWGVLVVKAMMSNIAQHLFGNGFKAQSADFSVERDASLRATNLALTVGADFEGTEAQYCMMAYIAWQEEQKRREVLEQLGIVGHIKLWWHWRFKADKKRSPQ